MDTGTPGPSELDLNAALQAMASKKRGSVIEPGLTEAEFARLEAELDVVFPNDLRRLLGAGYVAGNPSFPDWRESKTEVLREWVEQPKQQILLDVELGAFWWEPWGPRPQENTEALEVAAASLSTAPRLIPFFSHRFIAGDSREPGSPIFSIVQSDLVVYGSSLPTYLAKEFRADLAWAGSPRRYIDFWDPVAAHLLEA